MDKPITQKVIAAQIQVVVDITKDFGTGIGVATFVLAIFDQTQETNKAVIGLISAIILWYTSLILIRRQHSI